MESTPPPLVGFNNNVRYRGMRFHIQTEDSGVSRPHIITHLFADGGHVIKSVRTDYTEYVNRPDRPELIARLMREQHRAMALDLRDGRLDDTIARLAAQSPSEAPVPPRASECTAPPPAEPRAPSQPPASTRSRSKATSTRAAAGTPAADSPKKRPRQSGTPRKRSQQPAARKPGRPAPALPMKPGAESIFGTAPQESLDEVILSYVSHTKNGPPTRRTK